MFKREKGPKMPIPQEAISEEKTFQDNSSEKIEIKREKRGGPGFPRQEAIKEAEIKETNAEVEEIVEDMQNLYSQELKQIQKYAFYPSREEILSIHAKNFSEMPEVPVDILEKTVNKFLEKMENNDNEPYYGKRIPGLFASSICNKTVEQHVKRETEKGIKYKDIEPITVNLKESEIPIDHIGYKNKEKMNWIIEGNAGCETGLKMEGGEITVKGDTDEYAGLDMRGGKITIEGDAGWRPGFDMKGGEMIAKGNVGNQPGIAMEGGKITVGGDAGNEAGGEMEDGEITVKGNTEEDIGRSMKGGKITVEGNAGTGVGVAMEGGEITVKGDVEKYPGIYMRGGKITIEGKAEKTFGTLPRGEITAEDQGIGVLKKGGEIIIGGKPV